MLQNPNRPVLIVVDPCGRTDGYTTQIMAQLVKSVLGDVPDRIKIVQGVSTKSGFPDNYIGLSPLPPHPVNTNWEDEMTQFFDNGRSFVLCLKPPIELLSLMWAGKINPSVHTMAIYGSFNIRTLFNEKHKFARAVTPNRYR